MRIAVTGAHGTGKTTLSKLIAGKLKYRFIPEAAFQAYQAGFQLNEKTGIEAELWIACRQIELEMAAGENWVSDRCLVDTLAYIHHFSRGDNAMLNVASRIALPRIKLYDLVLYLPSGEFPIEDDGFRSTDQDFQAQADRMVQAVLETYSIPHHRITGTREERLAKVKHLLGDS